MDIKKKHKKAKKKIEKQRKKALKQLQGVLADLTNGNLEHLFRELPPGDPAGYEPDELVLPGLEYHEKT